MHGATLLDIRRPRLAPGDPLERRWPLGSRVPPRSRKPSRKSRKITGNIAMPGFTAPKLAWVLAEPEIFAAIKTVLLPKDYVRLRMTGEKASDLSDAAGTLWVDVAKRQWSSEMLDVTGLTVPQMPKLVGGTDVLASCA